MPVERISSLNYELCSPPPSSDVRTWGYKINADSKEVVEKEENKKRIRKRCGGVGDYRSGDPAAIPMDYITNFPSIIVRVQSCPAAATTHSLGVLSLSLFSVFCPSLSPSP
ncbi:hypothetical protein GW17_00042074 [Ensete ventricosum]|nr:hypothetical protein GW17_00042074 [Ensete ventricosum]